MGIKFACPHCRNTLNVKSELAGKRGRCPHCQQKIEIPTESGAISEAVATVAAAASLPPAAASAPTADQLPHLAAPSPDAAAPLQPSSAPLQSPSGEAAQFASPVAQAGPLSQPAGGAAAADLISEAPQLQWYVMPPGATNQYGPAVGEEFRNWIKEGRVTPETLVWRQDWPEWRAAGGLFPELGGAYPAQPSLAAPMAPGGFAIPTAAGAMPTAAGAAPMAYPLGAGLSAPHGGAADGFPVSAPAPVSSVGGRGRRYRARSNAGPMIAIVVLLLAMIPLSYFVWKVINDQFSTAPPAAASSTEPAE